MMSATRWRMAVAAACLALAGSAARGGSGPTLLVPDAALRRSPTIIVFGDSRFTEPTNVTATNPKVRRALIAKIADEHPDAILVTGDLVWHGDNDDYGAFRLESEAWTAAKLRIFPALGNHEFQRCGEEEECLRNWWGAFPQLEGRRWYSAQFGRSIYAIMLDSDASLLPDTPQRMWLESELAALPSTVRFVLLVLHHPLVTGIDTPGKPDYPRQNEIALDTYLQSMDAANPTVRFIVIAGHIHNYARFLRNGMTYVISGGGGGVPAPLDRGPTDLYKDESFPNYHYVRLVLGGDRLSATMIRLPDPDEEHPRWEVKDRFEVRAKDRRR
jgi:hypothetical protein